MTGFELSRIFGRLEQERFAKASGDFNPMHMDPIAARRTQAGAPVVHGVHAALWAIDALIAAGLVVKPITAIDVAFRKFIYVGDEVTLRINESEDSLTADLVTSDLVVTTITIRFSRAADVVEQAVDAQDVHPGPVPLEPDFSDLENCSGRLARTLENQSVLLFPHAAKALGAEKVDAIAKLSTIVGMLCPGLHSIFNGFKLIVSNAANGPGIAFRSRRVDKRFRKVELAVSGSGLEGVVTAFMRQPPVVQSSVDDIRPLVREGEFSGTTALIVGGSRGIGAFTARAIAAGGGRVIITYAAGEADAHAVAKEIGGAAVVRRYDAREDAASQLADLEWEINELYYFATAQISRQKVQLYSPILFAEFCQLYVNGFEAVCSAIRATARDGLVAFYPSSIYVEERERDLTEYAMAKSAGEVLCADLNRSMPGLHILVKRLPRVRTDQTATILPTQSIDAAEVMLPVIREMRAYRLTKTAP